MIIECQACHARFKLDESRIKGKGARIRCRKCGESIIVMKSDIPPTPPHPPGGKGLLDLRATLDAPETAPRTSRRDEVDDAFDKIFAAEPRTGRAPPREERRPAPPPEGKQEKVAGKTAEPREATTRLSPDEIDAAFDGLLREDTVTETVSRESADSAPSEAEVDTSFESPLFSEADTPPPSKEERHLDRPLPDGPIPPEPEPAKPFEEPSSPRMEAIQEELADLAEKRRLQEEARGQATRSFQIPPSQVPPPEAPPPKILEIERPPAARPRTAAPPRRTSAAFLVLLLIVLAGGGVYFASTDQGRGVLNAIFSALKPYLPGGKGFDRPFKVENLSGFYATGGKAGRMFVVQGMVTNEGPGKTSGIRIRAELLDDARNPIGEKTAYAGDIIPDIVSAERDQIETAMANRFGEKLSNVDVAQGQTVPFMVVFFDPPEGIAEYRVDPLKGE